MAVVEAAAKNLRSRLDYGQLHIDDVKAWLGSLRKAARDPRLANMPHLPFLPNSRSSPDSLATQYTRDSEQALISANRELIERFEKKIQGIISRVWGKNRRLW